MNTNTPLKLNNPSSLRHRQLLEWLQEKAVELQSRESRQNSEYLETLMRDLEKSKFECLQGNPEIRSLFSNVSRRVEICVQQAEAKLLRERKKKKFRESFGFGDLDEEDLGFWDSDEEDEEKEIPDYLKDFRGDGSGKWGKQAQRIVIETDGLQDQKQFGQIDGVDLADLENSGRRMNSIER